MKVKTRSGISIVIALLVGSLFHTEAAIAQTEIFEFNGTKGNQALGAAVASAGDVNADGIDDIAVGAPGNGTAAGNFNGRVTLYSGADGSVIRQYFGTAEWERLGSALDSAGDINRDQVPDLIVGSPFTFGGGVGKVQVFSGKDGSLLWSLSGDDPNEHFGITVAGVGDVDRDRVPDIAAAGFDFFSGAGQVYVFSGRTGKRLAVLREEEPDIPSAFGISVRPAGDLDGDGHADILVGNPLAEAVPLSITYPMGKAYAYSGKDFSLLLELTGDGSPGGFGISVDSMGDLDGDGVPEILVGETFAVQYSTVSWPPSGKVSIFSGVDGTYLDSISGAGSFGTLVRSLGDVDEDGVPDVMVSTIPPNFYNGTTSVRSGKDLSPISTLTGTVCSPLGDLDGDGRPEVVIGLPDYDVYWPFGVTWSSGPGKAVIYSIDID